AFRSSISPIRAPSPRRGRIRFFDCRLLLQTAVAAKRHKQKSRTNRGDKKSDGSADHRSAGSGIVTIREKRKQGEHSRGEKHQPKTDEERGRTLGRLGHTTSLKFVVFHEIGRKYRFVLVVTTGYAACGALAKRLKRSERWGAAQVRNCSWAKSYGAWPIASLRFNPGHRSLPAGRNTKPCGRAGPVLMSRLKSRSKRGSSLI